MLKEWSAGDSFYARKFADLPAIESVDDLARLPFTTKAELTADQQARPPYGTTPTRPIDEYSRLHQTSGTTTGTPLRWPDTPAGWDWLLGCWQAGFRLMGLTAAERAFFPFSFGPFLGFWSAFEAATRFGMLGLPGGGMGTPARVRFLLDHRATVVFATPTYALHLAEYAAAEGIDLANSAVRAVVVAGEPGGCLPATRDRIGTAWGARVFDHYGMTEIGPVAFEPADDPGSLVVLDSEYIAEIVDPAGAAPTPPGAVGELVLTNLGRVGSALARYRTGDLVKATTTAGGSTRLVGGILGRADDMIHVRGNNLYPTAIEAIVRRFPEIAEFRVLVDESGPMADLTIEIEPTADASGPDLASAVGRAVRDELLFRVAVTPVPPGSLPRFEMKARRVVRVRTTT